MDYKKEDIPISIHALREEGDETRRTLRQAEDYFYPRPPRGGRRVVDEATKDMTEISIHALREEGDPLVGSVAGANTAISIHALREEGDGMRCIRSFWKPLFLSTPSARRATRITGMCVI